MYLLQLVQALKYENFSDILGGLEPGSKRDGQGLGDESTLDRSELSHRFTNLSGSHCDKLSPLIVLGDHRQQNRWSDIFRGCVAKWSS